MDRDTSRDRFLAEHGIRAARVHWNLSLALLSAGRLREGFIEYEWRWRVPRLSINQSPRNFDSRLWLGEAPLKGKSIPFIT